MSKLRANQIETLDGSITVNVTDLVDDLNTTSVTTSTGMQTLVEALDSRVIYVDTISDLQTLDTGKLKFGQKVHVTEYDTGYGYGGGCLYWDSMSTEPDNGGTVFQVSGVATGRWKRQILNGEVHLDWFAPDYTGTTEVQSIIQSAVDATPTGGELIYPAREGTLLIDVASNQPVARPRGIVIDRPMAVRGNRRMVTKVRDFCSAWQTYTGVISAYQVVSSGVTIDGLVVDANADNHYETDGSGFRWWEAGPELKRPPNGIEVHCGDLENNLEHIIVENCIIHRPLAGVSVVGGLDSGNTYGFDDPGFLDGSLETNLIIAPVVRNNTVYRARGNDFIFVRGVRDGAIRNNISYNSMYHVVRLYVSVIGCEVTGNKAHIDHDYIYSLYNLTDNGYWRTNDDTSESYKMPRTGYCCGSIYTTEETNAFNKFISNEISYKRTLVSYDICDETKYHSLLARNLQSFTEFSNNTVNRPPICGMATSLSPPNTSAPGIVFDGNTINWSWREAGKFRGLPVVIRNNKILNCSYEGGYNVLEVGQGVAVYNEISTMLELRANAFSTGDSPVSVFISDNRISGYVDINGNPAILDNPTDFTVHGTEGGGISLELLNGWGIGMTTDSGRNDPKAIINAAGYVHIEGYINGASASSDSVFNLPSMYHPTQNSNSPAIQTHDMGDGTPIGFTYVLRVARDGQAFLSRAGQPASRCAFQMGWYADKPLPS